MRKNRFVRWLLTPVRAYREYKRLKVAYPEAVENLRQTGITLAETQDQLVHTANERNHLRRLVADYSRFAPPGHFYSPVPSAGDVEPRRVAGCEHRWFLAPLPAINMDDPTQLQMLECLKPYYSAVPFKAAATEGLLYHFDNPHYSYTDGIVLFCMLNHFRLRRLIEIGSGFSTCAILDTNRICIDSKIQVMSIEPYPELFARWFSGSPTLR